MKKTTKTIELTIERSDFVYRPAPRVVSRWCTECGRPVQFITPEDAARTTGISARTIYQCVETSTIHFTETPEGLLLVCLDSLARLS